MANIKQESRKGSSKPDSKQMARGGEAKKPLNFYEPSDDSGDDNNHQIIDPDMLNDSGEIIYTNKDGRPKTAEDQPPSQKPRDYRGHNVNPNRA